MRKDKGQAEKKNLWRQIITALYGISALFFVICIFRLGILPGTYLAALVAVMAVISLLLIRVLLSRKEGTGVAVSAVIAAILAICMAGGSLTIGGTLNFFDHIKAGGIQTHTYYVVVKADSSYESLEDLNETVVSTLQMKGEAQEKARQKLLEKVTVAFDQKENLEVLTKDLMEEKAQSIYLSEAYYSMAMDEIEGFDEESTRILETINVKVDSLVTLKEVDVTKDPFNVYISGIDTTGSISNVSRSDVNMVMSVNPATRQILLTSIPRDYHVILAGYGSYDKLTHSGIYGVEETVATVEDLLDIQINYYVKVNFTTVTKLVDALGGITVESDHGFTSVSGHTYVEGMNQLNGEQALAFARERKAFSSGDNQRVKNQQAVISGIIDKATGSTAILTQYNSLLAALEDNMETNFSQKEITSLVKMQLGDMRGWHIERCSLTGKGSYSTVYSMPSTTVYVMEPNQSSVDEAKIQITKVFNGSDS